MGRRREKTVYMLDGARDLDARVRGTGPYGVRTWW